MVVDWLKGEVKTVTAEFNALKARRSTLASQATALRGGWLRDCAQIETLTTARDTTQTEVQKLRARVDCFEVTRRDVNAAITRLRGEIREMDRRPATRYRECRDVGVRGRFAVR